MAGAGLVAIKRRIKSITSTQKITKAMGLVATSKLRKVKNQLEGNDKYSIAFNSIVNEFVKGAEGKNIYINGNKSRKKLYIVLSSDSGLCGGFNASAVNKLTEAISKDKEGFLLISVGQKGRMYLNRLKLDTIAEYVDIPDVPTLKEAEHIAYKVLDLYSKGEVGEVYVVYTRFFSTIKQVASVEKMLPLENKEIETEKKVFVKFEPSIDEMIDDVVIMQLKQQILNYMIHSKASEQGSRTTAMDGATKNANDLLDKLNLQYNRQRQAAITAEISEIVSGAEAQK